MNKFRAKKQEIDGYVFDSKKEAKRYLVLKEMMERGEISSLTPHKKFLLIPKMKDPSGKAIRKAEYTADFVYLDADGHQIVEDVKSPPTRKKADYKLRKKLLYERYGLWIKEI